MSERIAIAPGSFDPPTDGHINIICRALKMFDKVIVGVAQNTSKNPLFTADERVELLREIFKDRQNVEVHKFDGLLVKFAREMKSNTIIRGIRNMGDYEYEAQLSLANKALYPELEFVFMLTEGKYSHLSSSIIKEVLMFGGCGSGMIHPLVEQKLKEKFKNEIR